MRYLLILLLAGCSTGGAFHNPSCLFFCTSEKSSITQPKEITHEKDSDSVPTRPVK